MLHSKVISLLLFQFLFLGFSIINSSTLSAPRASNKGRKKVKTRLFRSKPNLLFTFIAPLCLSFSADFYLSETASLIRFVHNIHVEEYLFQKVICLLLCFIYYLRSSDVFLFLCSFFVSTIYSRFSTMIWSRKTINSENMEYPLVNFQGIEKRKYYKMNNLIANTSFLTKVFQNACQ